MYGAVLGGDRQLGKRGDRVGHVAQHYPLLGDPGLAGAERLHDARAAERGGESAGADAELAGARRIVGDRDADLGAAELPHAGHALHRAHARNHRLLDDSPERPRRVGPRNGILEQRLLVELLRHVVPHARRRRARREVGAQHLQAFEHVEPRETHVGVGIELDRETGRAFARLAAGLEDAAHTLYG